MSNKTEQTLVSFRVDVDLRVVFTNTVTGKAVAGPNIALPANGIHIGEGFKHLLMNDSYKDDALEMCFEKMTERGWSEEGVRSHLRVALRHALQRLFDTNS